jgi:hypothetical protein
MKTIIALLASLLLAACATTADPQWTPVVTPYDQAPESCTKQPVPPPQPSLEAHDGLQAARAYKRLKNSYVDLSAEYEKCQAWAKGQR